jgi:hypothetical protein
MPQVQLAEAAPLLHSLVDSHSVSELLANLKSVLKKAFQAEHINFYLMDKDLQQRVRSEGLATEVFYHLHFRFEGVAEHGVARPRFQSLKEAFQFESCSAKEIVFPIYPVTIAGSKDRLPIMMVQTERS